MNRTVLQALNLVKNFSKGGETIKVLRDLNLSISSGELISIVGASGVGKSTLLHILGALDSPTAGKIYYNSTDLFKMSEKELANFRNRKIGFVFQFHYLLKEFSALENTIIPAIISGISPNRAKEKAFKLLSQIGLSERVNHKPGELSGGEQQRVAIIRALIMDPEIILADEPTGNLDPETGEKVSNQLIELNKKTNTTMIIVTHNMKLAEKTDRILRLETGKIDDIK